MTAVGALRTGTDPYISITQIRKLTSANEIAHQILTACAAHIDIVEEKDGTFGATPIRPFGVKSGVASSGFEAAARVEVVDRTPARDSGVSAAQMEEQVYQFIQSGKATQWGFSKSDCVVKFKALFSETDVNKAIEQLLDDARIYDTGDEVHFKSIE